MLTLGTQLALSTQDKVIIFRAPTWRTGLTRSDKVGGPSTSVRRLVMQETMQAVDSERTFSNVAVKMDRLPHDNVWAAFNAGLARQLFLLTWFRMLESPTTEKIRDILTKMKKIFCTIKIYSRLESRFDWSDSRMCSSLTLA